MPCSPGMRACMQRNPGCQHLQFVLEHRSEMSTWEVRRDEGGLGYKSETADWEKENPAPRLQDKMIHREKPPELGEIPPVHANPQAEEVVLATAMFDQRAVALIEALEPKEFTDPLNKRIAETIVELEDRGVRADAVAVEADLRMQPDVPQDARWDSSMPLGDVDRTQFGLQQWENMSPIYDNALWAAHEVRSQTQANQTEAMLQWGQKQVNGTPQDLQAVRKGMTRVSPDLQPGQRSPLWDVSRPYRNPESLVKEATLTPAKHPHSTKSQRLSRART